MPSVFGPSGRRTQSSSFELLSPSGPARAWYQSPTRRADRPRRRAVARDDRDPDDDRQQDDCRQSNPRCAKRRATGPAPRTDQLWRCGCRTSTTPLHGHLGRRLRSPFVRPKRIQRRRGRGWSGSRRCGGALVGGERGTRGSDTLVRLGDGLLLLLLRLRSLNHCLLLRDGGGDGGGAWRWRWRRRDVLDDLLLDHGCRDRLVVPAAHGLDGLSPSEVLDQRDEGPTESHHEDDQHRAQVREADHDCEQDQEACFEHEPWADCRWHPLED